MFREDMISDGIENCVQYIHNFDPEKSKNPFAYFTQIIHYAFLSSIQKEKKQLEIKTKIIERTGFDEVMMVDDSLLSGIVRTIIPSRTTSHTKTDEGCNYNGYPLRCPKGSRYLHDYFERFYENVFLSCSGRAWSRSSHSYG
jgi:hypothetical protein